MTRNGLIIPVLALLLQSAPVRADNGPLQPMDVSKNWREGEPRACPPQIPQFITVKLQNSIPHDNTDLTAEQIRKMTGPDTDSTLRNDTQGIVIGATKSLVHGRAEIDTGKRDLTDTGAIIESWGVYRRSCVRALKVTYTVVYEPEVYIAAELLKQGCRYSASERHEQRHVDTFIETVNNNLPMIEDGVTDYFKNLKIEPVLTYEELRKEQDGMAAALEEGMKPVLDKIKEENHRRQAAIDTDKSFFHDEGLCPIEYKPTTAYKENSHRE